MQRFIATMDNLAKALTITVCIVVIIPLITIFELFAKTHNWQVLGVPAFVMLVFGITFLYRPKAYEIGLGGLAIVRQIGNLNIPLSQIESIRPVRLKDYGFGLRTFGSGGFLGYLGWFWYKDLGHLRIYATDRSKMLMITLKEERASRKHIVISPDDTEAFLMAFRNLKLKR